MGKKLTTMMVGGGFIAASAPNIILNKKLEDDIDNLRNSIKKIKSGIIVILPEGTRFTPEKRIIANKYSKDNNLPVFNNTLFPKMKGLWLICNILIKQNRMGNIIDISALIENMKNQQIKVSHLLSGNLGNTLCVINSYIVPYDGSLVKYNNFKKWFLEIWKIKDNTLENMYNMNDMNIYKRIKINTKLSDYIILIFILVLSIFISFVTKGKFITFGLAISYIITFYKYFKK